MVEDPLYVRLPREKVNLLANFFYALHCRMERFGFGITNAEKRFMWKALTMYVKKTFSGEICPVFDNMSTFLFPFLV